MTVNHQKSDPETDDVTEKLVGILTATKIKVWRKEESLCPLESADEKGAEVYDAVQMVWNAKQSEFSESLGLEGFENNILVIDSLVVTDEFRGKQIGLAILSRAIEVFGEGCAVVVLMAGCLRSIPSRAFLTSAERDLIEKAILNNKPKFDKKKLIKYYKRLGFRQIARSSYMYIDLACKWGTDIDEPDMDEEIQ